MKQQAAKETEKRGGSELNRLEHGGRSTLLVLPTEHQEQWDELLAAYRADYADCDLHTDMLVVELA